MEAGSTRIRISVGPAEGMGTSSSEAPGPVEVLRNALMVVGGSTRRQRIGWPRTGPLVPVVHLVRCGIRADVDRRTPMSATETETAEATNERWSRAFARRTRVDLGGSLSAILALVNATDI